MSDTAPTTRTDCYPTIKHLADKSRSTAEYQLDDLSREAVLCWYELHRVRAELDNIVKMRTALIYRSELAEDDRLKQLRRAIKAEAQAKADTERIEWFFGSEDKMWWMSEYMHGMREGWTINQWRSAIDAARKAKA